MMRYVYFLFLALASLQAAELPLHTHRYQLGGDFFWAHYSSGSSLDENGMRFKATINGYFAGARLGYDYLQPDAFYAGTEGVVAWGRDHVDQRTTPSHFATPGDKRKPKISHQHKPHLWVNLEQRLGYNAQSTVLPQFIVTPYLGVGWHYESAFDAHAFWYYGAAGLKTLQRFYNRFELGFEFKGMFAFDIHDKKIISILITQEKKTFWGLEVALPIRWLVNRSGRWDVEFKPYLLKLNLNAPQTIMGFRLVTGYNF